MDKRLLRIPSSELFPNGLYWLWSKAKGRLCYMPRHGKRAVLVFNSDQAARKYVREMRQPLAAYTILHIPLFSLADKLKEWATEWDLLEWPAIKGETYVSQVVEIADLLKKISSPPDEPIEDGQHRH